MNVERSGDTVATDSGVAVSRLAGGALRAMWNRWDATGGHGRVRSLVLPVVIGWSLVADPHYSPVRLAASALVVAALLVRFTWPAFALVLASACLLVAPAGAVLTVVVLAYGATYRTTSPYRTCAAFAAAWVLITLAVWHRTPDLAGAGAQPFAIAAMVAVSCLAPAAAVGAIAGGRSRRLRDLRERNEILAQSNLLGQSQAKMAERARIAGEMHDLIGHRLSLISLHAGALELGTRTTAPHLSEQAVLLRTTAKQALDELREVLGILKYDTAGSDGPDPHAADHAGIGTRADLEELVAASRSAGTPVSLHWVGDDLTAIDHSIRRAVHRLVRESLTNVHKHAPGMPTRVCVEHHADTVSVEVGNRLPAPSAATTAVPRTGTGTNTGTGTGLGLIGLHERIRLTGGTLTVVPGADRFVVRALLPTAAHRGHTPTTGDLDEKAAM
jgi:signal transduction histidine kinase